MLDSAVKGIIDGLEKNGFKRGSNLEVRVESAQANAVLATQIASKFINQKSDIVVGVGTISAQSLIKYASDGKTKLVFSSVTDPLGAGLAQSLKKPAHNISGVSNSVDLEPQIKLFQKLQPKLQRLGILYNPSEINSVSIVKKLEIICPKLGLTLVKQTVSKTSDVVQNATKLANKVDAIFISNDNTALAAMESIIHIGNVAKIPVYVSDTDVVETGALAALGPNQYEIGLQTGAMVAHIIQGEDIGTIEIEFPDKTYLYLNLEAAKITGIQIPEEIKDQAAKIIEKNYEPK